METVGVKAGKQYNYKMTCRHKSKWKNKYLKKKKSFQSFFFKFISQVRTE